MSRNAWLLTWRLATLVAVLAGFRVVVYLVAWAVGVPWRTGWEIAGTAAFALAAAALAIHADRKRKALLRLEMPPPESAGGPGRP